jgi:hypothetical protein
LPPTLFVGFQPGQPHNPNNPIGYYPYAAAAILDAQQKNQGETYLLLDADFGEILTMSVFPGAHRRGVATGRMKRTSAC